MKEAKLYENLNKIKSMMGLPSEDLSRLGQDRLDEGVWDTIKYGLSKLGRYKAGGKILGKGKTDRDADAKTFALLTKASNQLIKDLHVRIKDDVPEFPNNKNQNEFLEVVMDIATVYDSIVAATKINPDEDGYLPQNAANEIIEDLAQYTKKYLDVDLKAAYSVFNENELVDADDDLNKNNADLGVLNYSNPHKVKDGYGDNPMPRGTGFAKDEVYDLQNEIEKSDLTAKFADTKDKVKKGQLQGRDSERMKTLKSWRLPTALAASSAAFGGLSWVIKYLFPDEITTVEEAKIAIKKAKEVLGVKNPGEGMTQIFNRVLGTKININTPIGELEKVIKGLGGGDTDLGIKILTQDDGILLRNDEAKKAIEDIINNKDKYSGQTFGDVFKGKWAGTGEYPDDVFRTKPGGQLSSMVTKLITNRIKREVVTKSATAAVAGPILAKIGITLAAGAATVALARYKGRKSSRAQVLNDLLQYLQPITSGASASNQSNKASGGAVSGSANASGGKGVNQKGVTSDDLFNQLKAYFKSVFNYSNQVYGNKSGPVGYSQAKKPTPPQKMSKNTDYKDIENLLEDYKVFSREFNLIFEAMDDLNRDINKKGAKTVNFVDSLEGANLSKNEIALLKKQISMLKFLIRAINAFTTDDKNLNKLIERAKGRPSAAMINSNDFMTLFTSDPKSLKIFVGNFNKTVYSTQFKNGNNLLDQLKKIGINKINEQEEGISKKAQQAIYNQRREFLSDLPNLINDFYAIFSFILSTRKKNPTNENTSKNGYQPFLREDYDIAEIILMHDRLNSLINEQIKLYEDSFKSSQEDALTHSKSSKIFTQLAAVIPDMSNRIAMAYKKEYGEPMNRVALSKFLETILGSLSKMPKGRIVQMINRADFDLKAYNKLLSTMKKPDEGDVAAASVDPEQKGDEKKKTGKETKPKSDSGVNNASMQFDRSNPKSFLPDRVGDFDLSKINSTARQAVTNKAIEVIKRYKHKGFDLDQELMLKVMNELLTDINANSNKKIPKFKR
jgi:hypothetical protein